MEGIDDCPDEDALAAFVAGCREAPAIDAHIDRCPACFALIVELAAQGDTGPASAPGPEPEERIASIDPDPIGHARFQITRCLGEGGMGVVYEAWDRERGARVALKTVRALGGALRGGTPPSPVTDPRAGERLLRFKNEFRALQGLYHPNLVTLGELFEREGRWFFTMELLDGQNLLSWVRRGGEARLRDAFAALARGLSALHAAGKVHRDVKPSNVLVTREGRVVLLDFGLVADADGAHELTQSAVVGTVAYMAPEQAASEPTGPAADWYALGVLLYEALTGDLPFRGAALDVLYRKRTDAAPRPSDKAPAAPPDLDALAVALLDPDPARRPRGEEILAQLGASAPAPALLRPFVGRGEELRRLDEAFAATREGRAVTVIVEGESGIGKSALAARFLEELAARERSAVVLVGRCHEQESIPHQALDGLVDALSVYLGGLPDAAVAALLPRRAGLLPRAFPVLGRVRAIAEAPAPPEIVDPQELSARVFAALRELLHRLAEQGPVAALIDDLQRADAESVARLADLLRPPDPPPLLLVATCRAPAAARLSGEGGLAGDVRVMRLSPLGEGEARQLSVALSGAAKSPPDVAEAAGHPLFIAELVRHAGAAPAPREGAPREGAPLRLDEVLLERVGALDAPSRRLLEILSVAGEPLDEDVAARATGSDPDTWMKSAAGLRAGHLVRAAAPGAVEPYHDRVREAVVGHLAPEALAEHHRALAGALLAAGRADPERLSRHYRGAGDLAEAARHATLAAAQAEEMLAFGRAAELYRLALSLRAGEPDDGLRARLGDALANAGRGAEAAETFLDVAARAGGLAAFDLRARAAEQLLRSGQMKEGLDALRGVLREAGMTLELGAVWSVVRLLWFRARLRVRGLRFTVRPAEAIDPRALRRLDVCWTAGQGLFTVDMIARAEFSTRYVLMALPAGEPTRIARALAAEAALLAFGGSPSARRRAVALADRAEGLARETGSREALAFVALARGLGPISDARWRQAKEAFEHAEEVLLQGCVGVSWELAGARAFIVRALASLGEIGEVVRRVSTHIREAQRRGDIGAEIYLSIGPCNLAWLARDDVEGARRAVEQAEARWPPRARNPFYLEALLALCHIDLYAGDGSAAARRLVERPLSRFLLGIPSLRVQLRDLRIRCLLASGEPGQRAAAEAELTRLERDAPHRVAGHAAMSRAALARTRGDVAAAESLLETASCLFEAEEMSLHAAVARRRLGEIRGGAGGKAMVAEADAWMTAQEIRVPERFVAMLAPGFG